MGDESAAGRGTAARPSFLDCPAGVTPYIWSQKVVGRRRAHTPSTSSNNHQHRPPCLPSLTLLTVTTLLIFICSGSDNLAPPDRIRFVPVDPPPTTHTGTNCPSLCSSFFFFLSPHEHHPHKAGESLPISQLLFLKWPSVFLAVASGTVDTVEAEKSRMCWFQAARFRISMHSRTRADKCASTSGGFFILTRAKTVNQSNNRM